MGGFGPGRLILETILFYGICLIAKKKKNSLLRKMYLSYQNTGIVSQFEILTRSSTRHHNHDHNFHVSSHSNRIINIIIHRFYDFMTVET